MIKGRICYPSARFCNQLLKFPQYYKISKFPWFWNGSDVNDSIDTQIIVEYYI